VERTNDSDRRQAYQLKMKEQNRVYNEQQKMKQELAKIQKNMNSALTKLLGSRLLSDES